MTHKFKKAIFPIATEDGSEEREGYVCGIFGFYKESEYYFITHLPSGICVWVLAGYQQTRKLTGKLSDSNWGAYMLFGEQFSKEEGDHFATIINNAITWLQLEPEAK